MNTTETLEITDITVCLSFNGSEIYEMATFVDRRVSPWIHSMTTSENGSLALVIEEDTGEMRNVALTFGQIAEGFRRAVRLGVTHCGNYRIDDLDNSDACSADLILQLAVYGEIVWG